MTEGTFRCYVPKNFKQETLDLIGLSNNIISEYEGKGLMMTLRQLYYQLVQRGIIANKSTEYSRLGSIISDGRLAGLVSWSALEDRNRQLKGLRTYDAPGKALREAREGYRIDLWAGQPWRPEVWVEKAALEGVIASICNELRVDFFSCRGYNSQSEQWAAGNRFANYVRRGQRPIIFHLGDHDPSGLDMTRDNRDRLTMFAGTPILVQRLALNWPQIEALRPPPNPTKSTDSRADGYRNLYSRGVPGEESWELDALSPEFIRDLIRQAVLQVRDPKLWAEALEQEVDDQRLLDAMIEEVAPKGDDND